MTVNRKNNDNIKRVGTYVFSAVCGMVTSGLLVVMFSAFMYALGLPPHTSGVMALLSFAAGCFVCGFVCGCIKKHSGLRAGFICAAVMSLIVLAVSVISGGLTGEDAAVKLIAAAAAGCTGAVIGVNLRR